ncbi:hypothetical protein LAUMK191_05576 [Mycobacterium attenuatum]|uniref:hypothetical protein n=1 Tax=Mycobacterium attenuatum TaxID=2341086 RepID=UPI000F0134F5|nr:hypothetical protein [Mycobacterium attenuatum]VBA60548.1 hypothetical protein LAUMK191_05576 [Mycobacterium attenuatum]
MSKSEKLPLSPMLVQYLVGLCALKWDANAVDIDVTIGDMVPDEAAGTARDVDVTVTVDTLDGMYAFKGYEVKHEASPLDVADVDGLANKLNDMPSVTHRAIVSTSGFSKPAVKKAQAHGIDLYEMTEWTKPIEEQFPNLALAGVPGEVFRSWSAFLIWSNAQFWLGTDSPSFQIEPDTTLFDSDGNEHALYGDFKTLSRAMMERSTSRLYWQQPAQGLVGEMIEAWRSGVQYAEPTWPYAHTLDVANEEVYVRTDEKLHRVDDFTIYGQISWQRRPMYYCVMEKVPTGEPFAGALVAQSPIPGQMWAFILSTTDRTIQVTGVALAKKHLNSIRKLKLALPADE